MAVARHNIGYYIEAARALATRVAAATDRIDREREIPSGLAGELADKGFFRLLVPRSLGGAELDFLDYLRIVQIFGEVDGSVAWCINQNNVFATNSVRMPQQTAREIWSDRRAVVSNGPPISSAGAVPVDGGYRLTGRWNCCDTDLAASIASTYPGSNLASSFFPSSNLLCTNLSKAAWLSLLLSTGTLSLDRLCSAVRNPCQSSFGRALFSSITLCCQRRAGLDRHCFPKGRGAY